MSSPSTRIRAVLFDWAGTTIDHGSRAPVEVFVEVFRRAGVEISTAEARGPMGMAKREHIAAILATPRVADAWTSHHGQAPTEADIDRLYANFLPLQQEVLARHCGVIDARILQRKVGMKKPEEWSCKVMEKYPAFGKNQVGRYVVFDLEVGIKA